MLNAPTDNRQTIAAAQRLIAEGKAPEAVLMCKQRLAKPGAGKDPQLLAIYATGIASAGNVNEARKVLKKAIKDFPKVAELHCRLGNTYFREYRYDEARQHHERALRLDPDEPWINRCMADTLLASNNHQAALEHLERRMERSETISTDVALPLCQVYLKFKRFEDSLRLIDDTLASGELVPMIKTNFLFYRGDALRGLGRHDESFESYKQANDAVGSDFDRATHADEVDRSIAAWTPEAIASLPVSKRKSSHLVFIVGMFRSGTSLSEQIIASHPRAFGAGELPHVVNIVTQFKMGRKGSSRAVWDLAPLTAQNIDGAAAYYLNQTNPMAPGSDIITDKMPSNVLALGLIGQMFPDCKVVYCRRDPRDTLLSCYFNQFNADQITFVNELEDLGSAFNDYYRIMEHWKSVLQIPVLEVQYEKMIAEPQEQSRRLIEFTGLEWDDRCLEFHKTKRTTKTLSSDQVNKPIYQSSLARWKPYEAHLAPMMKHLPESSLWSPVG